MPEFFKKTILRVPEGKHSDGQFLRTRKEKNDFPRLRRRGAPVPQVGLGFVPHRSPSAGITA